jgi:SAM-dependent methyltransferase
MDTPTEVTKDDIFTKIADYYAAFFGTWVLNIGCRARLFESLRDDGPLRPDELASRLDYDQRYVETWCHGAYAFELLVHDAARGFSLAPYVEQVMLDASDPAFMGGRAEFFPLLTRDFEMYPDRLVDGGLYPFAERPPNVVQAMQAATRADGPNMVTNVLPSEPGLVEQLQAGGSVLDAGCGAGYALAAVADAYPSAELVGIEVDEASLAAARRLLGHRAQIQRLHVTELPYDALFDLVYANISLSHTWGAGAEVFDALSAALKPGAWLLVSDVPYPEHFGDLQSTGGRLFTGVTIYVSLLGHRLLTPSELLARMRGAGLVEVHLADQPARTRMMVLGRKAP